MPTFGPPQDGDADGLVSDLGRPLARKPRHDLVEQVSRSVAVQRRDRHRVAQPQPVELERLVVPRRIVDLVGRQDHRLAGAAEDVGDLLVSRRDAGLRVHHEDDEVGLLDGAAGLLGHLADERRRVGHVDAAGVDEDEALAGRLADDVLAVARDAGRLEDDRLALAVSRLTSVDLPTFGKPMTAAAPRSGASDNG